MFYPLGVHGALLTPRDRIRPPEKIEINFKKMNTIFLKVFYRRFSETLLIVTLYVSFEYEWNVGYIQLCEKLQK